MTSNYQEATKIKSPEKDDDDDEYQEDLNEIKKLLEGVVIEDPEQITAQDAPKECIRCWDLLSVYQHY